MQKLALSSFFFIHLFFLHAQKKDSLVIAHRYDTLIHVVHFDKDKYDLKREEQQKLDSFLVKNWMLKKQKVLISGHTDSDGNDAYNDALSMNRCQSVNGRIATLDLIPHDSVVIGAFGEKQLLKEEKSKADQAANRRVEVRIIHRVQYEKWVPCGGFQNCSKKIVLPQGTIYWVDTCSNPDYEKCIQITEYVTPESAREGGMHTMDDQGYTLVSGGMLKYDICKGLTKNVNIPIPESCDNPDMVLYEFTEDGSWKLIEGVKPEVTEIDGKKYYSFPITGRGVINCDSRLEQPSKPPKIVFKGKRGLKLNEVRISCDCPMTIQTSQMRKVKPRKIKMDRLCCPELQVYISATSKSGEKLILDYVPIEQLKNRKSILACKQEEVWRWFIFKKRKKTVYRFYKIREKDFQ